MTEDFTRSWESSRCVSIGKMAPESQTEEKNVKNTHKLT
jgi:hypothetical protein